MKSFSLHTLHTAADSYPLENHFRRFPFVVNEQHSSTPLTTMLHGFELWVPPVPDKYEDGLPIFEILGSDAQVVQFPLRAGRSVTCFSGAMAYMSNDVKLAVKLAGFQKTFGRLAGGGSLFQLTYTNEGTEDGYIAMTPDYPGVLVPINMSTSGKIVMLRDSFLCSTIDLTGQEVDISAGFNPAQSIAGVCCGGFDLIVQTMENGEWAFIMVSFPVKNICSTVATVL